MDAQEKEISRKLRPGRILIPLLLGIGVSAFLLYQNLSEVRFEKVLPGEGSFRWEDTNQNGKADLGLEEEFVRANGEDALYKRVTYSEVLKGISWNWHSGIWLLLAVMMMFLRDFAYMLRIRILTEKMLSWKQSFFVIMMWEFASALTPGVVGGAAVAMFILNRENVPLGRSTAIVMITAILDNLFYLVMVPLVLAMVGSHQLFPVDESKQFLGISMDLISVFWVAYGIVFLLFAFLLTGIFFNPVALKRTIVGIFSLPVLKRWKEGAVKTGDEIIITSKELRTKPISFWASAFGATFLSWSGRFLVVNCLIMGFISMGIMENLMVYARQLGMWVIMLISPTPGGSGIAEYAFTGFLSDLIPFGLIGIMAILWRLISYYPYLFIGSVILPRWLRKTRSVSQN